MKRTILMLGAACWLVPVSAAPAAPARPNILLIVVDDIGVGDLGFCGARQGNWKLVVLDEEGANRCELYNLAADPGEATDLAAQEPERGQALRTALDAWRASLKPQIIPPVPRMHDGQPAGNPTPKHP